jgi:hypothetical protein
MSNNYWDEEDEDDTTTDAQMDGSDLLKKLRKAKRVDEKRIQELTAALDEFTKKQKEIDVKSVLEKKGVNPKAARLILKDLTEVTEQSINDWLDDNGDLFGITPNAQDASQENDMDRAALRQQDIVTQGALTPDRAQDMEQRINNAQSAEDILLLLGRG